MLCFRTYKNLQYSICVYTARALGFLLNNTSTGTDIIRVMFLSVKHIHKGIIYKTLLCINYQLRGSLFAYSPKGNYWYRHHRRSSVVLRQKLIYVPTLIPGGYIRFGVGCKVFWFFALTIFIYKKKLSIINSVLNWLCFSRINDLNLTIQSLETGVNLIN